MSGGGGRSGGGSGARTRRLLGSACGAGLLPIAPGTWGSALTVAVMAALHGIAGWWDGLLPVATTWRAAALLWTAVLFALFVIGLRIGDRAEEDWGEADPGAFVLDEVVGQGLALLPLLYALPAPLPPLPVAAAFLLFRALDVIKPPPCRRLEGLPGGLGIMADDLAAGAYAAVCVAALRAAGL